MTTMFPGPQMGGMPGSMMMGGGMMGSGMMGPNPFGSGMMGGGPMTGMMGQPVTPQSAMMSAQLGGPMMGFPPMSPAGPTPMAMGRGGIMLQREPPIQKILDERPMPMVPTPWPGQQPPLRPGQPTGVGPDNLSPLCEPFRGPADRLPHAYRMYGYGNRQIVWSPSVPVPERNTGIMINAEFPLLWHMEGREAAQFDYGIRNQNWQRQGQWVKPYDPVLDMPDWKHKLFGDYESAVDMHQKKSQKDYNENFYRDLNRQRNQQGLTDADETAKKRMELEIMDDNALHGFWSNPEQVMYDRLD